MPVKETDATIVADYLNSLKAEDKALAQIWTDYNRARAAFEIAARRYAAVRDLVTENLGSSPYAENHEMDFATKGAFRFTHMSVGDAGEQVLFERVSALSIQEISDILAAGGLKADTRAIHAALINRNSIVKLKDGTFVFEEDADVIEDDDDHDFIAIPVKKEAD